MIVEGCEILLDVNQMFVRQGKKPTVPAALSSCFPKEAVPQFPRRSIDFPRKSTDLFTNEDGEEQTPRSQRSHSTVSYLSREQQLAALSGRRRLSSLRQSSLGNTAITGVSTTGSCTPGNSASSSNIPVTTGAAGATGASIVRHTLNLGTSPLSPSQTPTVPDRRGSDVPRIRKKSVRISDESFDECEELAASGAARSSVFSPEQTPSSSPENIQGGSTHWTRAVDLAPVEERISVDSGNSEEPNIRPPAEAPS